MSLVRRFGYSWKGVVAAVTLICFSQGAYASGLHPQYSCQQVISGVRVFESYHEILQSTLDRDVPTELSDPNYYKLLAYFEDDRYQVAFVDSLLRQMVSLRVRLVFLDVGDFELREQIQNHPNLTEEEVEEIVRERYRVGGLALYPDDAGRGERLILLRQDSANRFFNFTGNFVHEALHHRVDLDPVWQNPSSWINRVDDDEHNLRLIFEEFWVHSNEWLLKRMEPEWESLISLISSDPYDEAFDSHRVKFEKFMFYIYTSQNLEKASDIKAWNIVEGLKTGSFSALSEFFADMDYNEFESFTASLSNLYGAGNGSLHCTHAAHYTCFRPTLKFER